MKIDQIQLRAKRCGFLELVGSQYRDLSSKLIKSLNNGDSDAILGMESTKGPYTVIGPENLYVRNKDLVERVIDIDDAISVFRENAWKIGKGGDFEYIEFDGNGLVWTQDGPTMCAIWHLAKYISHGTRNI